MNFDSCFSSMLVSGWVFDEVGFCRNEQQGQMVGYMN